MGAETTGIRTTREKAGLAGVAEFIALTIFIFLALSALALGPAFLPALLRQDGFVLGVGAGTSMYPYIKPGDYLVIDPTPESIDLGEVVAYYHEGKLIGHRVVAITDEGYILKGDNNPQPDPWIVKRDEIVGEVEWVISNELLKRVAEMWFEKLT